MSKPKISCIINTRNEEINLDNCLRSVVNQTVKNIEIIVVDNNSTDKTKEIALRYTKNVYNKGPERSPQKNYGVQKAQGEWLLFIDADQSLENKVCVELLKLVTEDKEVEAAIIPEISFGEGFWAKVKGFEKTLYLGDESIEAARFISKNRFIEVEGYDETMVAGEDWDLTDRLKEKMIKFGRIKSYIHHNEGKVSLAQTAKKKYYYGTKMASYFQKSKNTRNNDRFTLLRSAYIRNWKAVIKLPHLAFGLLVLKSLEIISGGFGYITTAVKHHIY